MTLVRCRLSGQKIDRFARISGRRFEPGFTYSSFEKFGGDGELPKPDAPSIDCQAEPDWLRF